MHARTPSSVPSLSLRSRSSSSASSSGPPSPSIQRTSTASPTLLFGPDEDPFARAPSRLQTSSNASLRSAPSGSPRPSRPPSFPSETTPCILEEPTPWSSPSQARPLTHCASSSASSASSSFLLEEIDDFAPPVIPPKSSLRQPATYSSRRHFLPSSTPLASPPRPPTRPPPTHLLHRAASSSSVVLPPAPIHPPPTESHLLPDPPSAAPAQAGKQRTLSRPPSLYFHLPSRISSLSSPLSSPCLRRSSSLPTQPSPTLRTHTRPSLAEPHSHSDKAVPALRPARMDSVRAAASREAAQSARERVGRIMARPAVFAGSGSGRKKREEVEGWI